MQTCCMENGELKHCSTFIQSTLQRFSCSPIFSLQHAGLTSGTNSGFSVMEDRGTLAQTGATEPQLTKFDVATSNFPQHSF